MLSFVLGVGNPVSELRCTALHCTALHYNALHWATLHSPALYFTALHCTAVPYQQYHSHQPTVESQISEVNINILLHYHPGKFLHHCYITTLLF